MEIIAKISKGTKMDQVYIPKNRVGFDIGNYVVIKPLQSKKKVETPYFYNIKYIEPLKLNIINEISSIINKTINSSENIIITGSFLEPGFNFNDIDVLLIKEDKINLKYLRKVIEDKLKIRIHIISLDNKTLMKGLSTDPLYQMMLSRCISKKRFIYKVKRDIDYKILDLHLLKSKTLIDNYDILNGKEKYYLIRNTIAISLFLKNKKIDNERVDKKILSTFNLKDVNDIKQNMLNKNIFLKKYKTVHKKTFNKIMAGIEHESKQK